MIDITKSPYFRIECKQLISINIQDFYGNKIFHFINQRFVVYETVNKIIMIYVYFYVVSSSRLFFRCFWETFHKQLFGDALKNKDYMEKMTILC